MQTLTLQEIVTKAREFYLAGNLTAQDPDIKLAICNYRTSSGRCCAIGAAFTEATHRSIPAHKQYVSASHLRNMEGVIDFSDEEAGEIGAFQSKHDNWAQEVEAESGRQEDWRKSFVQDLNRLGARYGLPPVE